MPIIRNHFKKKTTKDKEEKSLGDPFYQTKGWKRLRNHHIKHHPFCHYCEIRGFITDGLIVDHYYPRRLYPELEWLPQYLRTACRTCDQKKRQIESLCFDKVVLKQKLEEAGYYK